MADKQHPILNYLRQMFGTMASGGVADADLLRRFVDERDEAAFELLLWRHAAMVLQVCRQVLRDTDAVEDAFQAAFLVFVRKAGSISRRESLGGWLYRVAYRIALQARAQLKKRASTDVELDRLEAPKDANDADQHELRRIIGEEVNRLPAKYRAAVVACYFEAKTLEEAAHQLGWPRGTVASRLARARELLRRRLIRRGVTLPTAAFAAALSVQTSAALAGLIHSTIQTAKLFAIGQSMSAILSPRIVALTEGVLKAMYWTRVKIVMVVLLIAGLGSVGATFWGIPRSAAEPPSESAPRAGIARGRDKEPQPEVTDKHARDMAQSRLNLRKLALAMHAYAEKHGHLPPPAIYDKKGKALLSWRVALLPYINQSNLYKLFHLDEPWDSPHNRPLSEVIVKMFAPVGKPEMLGSRTYYQIFLGALRAEAAGAGAESDFLLTAAFVKGQATPFPAGIRDGTSNTILIVEAGNAVPWTKPEDLHYAFDEPLPELGGLFPEIFHAVFADGEVRALTKKYDEKQLRAAITANSGEKLNLARIEARNRPEDRKAAEARELRRHNEVLRSRLYDARRQIELLKEELTVERERFGGEGDAAVQEESKKTQVEIERLNAEICRWLKPLQKRNP